MAIHIEEQLRVDAPREQVWTYFGDPLKVAPCLPGAQLTEIVDERHYKGQVRIQVGPVVATYQGTITVETLDQESGRMTMVVRAAQVGAVGRAEGRIICLVHPSRETETQVTVTVEMTVSGPLMQLAGGLIGSVAKQLFLEFSRCAQQTIMAKQDA